MSIEENIKENTQLMNKYDVIESIFKTSDYDLSFKERRAKYNNFDVILCENYNKGTKSLLLHKLDIKERKAKNIYFDIILCESCSKEIDNYSYYCTYCYNKETDSNEKGQMKFESKFRIFNISDYNLLNLEGRRAKYKNYYYILCENYNKEIDNYKFYCTYCYYEEADIKKNRMEYGTELIIFNTSNYNLNLEERRAKYKNFYVILCENCNRKISYHHDYYYIYCYNKETDIVKKERKAQYKNFMAFYVEIVMKKYLIYIIIVLIVTIKRLMLIKRYGSNFGILNTSDYNLSLKERMAKYKDFDTILCGNYYNLSFKEKMAKYKDFDGILCGNCYNEINEKYYCCTGCYNEETDIISDVSVYADSG
ncbi:kinase-like domain-containing protein [Rhizophagus clarus]|uniref:Kinase-like domain-containing protein n=1 Tax=Rhizophagus clarus TaxID=94130 RepID=A0A8H3LQN8_9GLOM|nr:kinase-like domain-containing protein [Rhizophagus clarus]